MCKRALCLSPAHCPCHTSPTWTTQRASAYGAYCTVISCYKSLSQAGPNPLWHWHRETDLEWRQQSYFKLNLNHDGLSHWAVQRPQCPGPWARDCRPRPWSLASPGTFQPNHLNKKGVIFSLGYFICKIAAFYLCEPLPSTAIHCDVGSCLLFARAQKILRNHCSRRHNSAVTQALASVQWLLHCVFSVQVYLQRYTLKTVLKDCVEIILIDILQRAAFPKNCLSELFSKNLSKIFCTLAVEPMSCFISTTLFSKSCLLSRTGSPQQTSLEAYMILFTMKHLLPFTSCTTRLCASSGKC